MHTDIIMDIDTRRANGIYSKIVVPNTLRELINETFTKLTITRKRSIVRLGKLRQSGTTQDNIIKLYRSTLIDHDEVITTHQLYIVQHIENDIDHSMYMMGTYDIPPQSSDIWYTFPMSEDCEEPKVYIAGNGDAMEYVEE